MLFQNFPERPRNGVRLNRLFHVNRAKKNIFGSVSASSFSRFQIRAPEFDSRPGLHRDLKPLDQLAADGRTSPFGVEIAFDTAPVGFRIRVEFKAPVLGFFAAPHEPALFEDRVHLFDVRVFPMPNDPVLPACALHAGAPARPLVRLIRRQYHPIGNALMHFASVMLSSG